MSTKSSSYRLFTGRGSVLSYLCLLVCSSSLLVSGLGARGARLQESSTQAPERVEVKAEPPARQAVQKLRPPQEHRAIIRSMPEQESDETFELRENPEIPDIPGVSVGTGPVPLHLRGNPYRLSFVGGDFTPTSMKLDPLLADAMARAAKGKLATYGFVMFEGRITAAKLQRVERLGVKLHAFHTFQSYRATIPFSSVRALVASKDVRWVGYARPQQKMTPELLAAVHRDPSARSVILVTLFEKDEAKDVKRLRLTSAARITEGSLVEAEDWALLPGGKFQRGLEKLGARILNWIPDLQLFVVDVPLSAVPAIAELDYVHALEHPMPMSTTHDRSTRMIGTDYVRKSVTSNGSSTVMGIIDTGVWLRGSANPTGHRDLLKTAVGFDYLTSGGFLNDTNGHGTHVAGTMLGTGAANLRMRGNAPGAAATGLTRFFIAKAIPNSTGAASINAIQRFRSSFTLGSQTTPRPHVVNGSYGTSNVPSAGLYGTDASSIALDTAVYASNQLYVMAAGNSGGWVGYPVWKSCGSPAVAKNSFAVGNVVDHHGSIGYRLDEDGPLTSQNLVPGTTYLYRLGGSAYTESARVAGVSFKTRASSALPVECYLYAADSSGRPTGSPLRSTTVTAGTAEAWVDAEFSSPYVMPAGVYYFVGFKAPTTGTMRWPRAAKGSTFPPVHFERTSTATNWTGPHSSHPQVKVRFGVEVGETVASSAKGSTRDGRMKPIVTAPGHAIASCETMTQDRYVEKGGTSMASPHVAGLAADLLDKIPSFKYKPYLAKAMIAAAANPFGGLIYSTSTASPSFLDRQGLGLVDAYKTLYSNNTSKGWTSGYSSLIFSSSSAGGYIEFTIPTDATSLKIAMCFDEGAPSANATRACLADVDLYVDAEPFTSGLNTGDYVSRRAWDTWDWVYITQSRTMTGLRGKKVRIKVYPRVRPLKGAVKVGVAYVCHRGEVAPSASVSLVAPEAVRPGVNFEVTATVNVASVSSTNAALHFLPQSTVVPKGLRAVSADNTLLAYPAVVPMSTDSLYGTTLGNLLAFYPALHRQAIWTLRASGSGLRSLGFELRSDNLYRSAIVSGRKSYKSICVDGQAPPAITGLSTATHSAKVWSNKTKLQLNWNLSKDLGCAGIAGVGAAMLSSPAAPRSPTLSALATSTTLNVNSSSAWQYACVAAWDKAGNRSAASSLGPFLVDAVSPTLSAISLASGNKFTTSTLVPVVNKSADQHSGLAAMSYSWDQKTWSPWLKYQSAFTANLLSYGGNSADGTKTFYLRVRDRALNVSSTQGASIILDRTGPIGAITIASGLAATSSLKVPVVVSAKDSFSGVAEMRFSGDRIKWSAWEAYSSASRVMDLSLFGANSTQGTKTLYVQFKDRVANLSSYYGDTIIFDTMRPTGSVVLEQGKAFTNSVTVSVSATASDGVTGKVTHVRYSGNGSTWSSWQTYSGSPTTAKLSTLGGSSADGTKYWYAQFRDHAMNISATYFDTIALDTKPPTGSIVLAGGAPLTNTRVVTATVTASDPMPGGRVTQMRFSGDGRTWAVWQTFTGAPTTTNLNTLGGGSNDGLKTRYIQYKDEAENVSATYSDTITLDTALPTGSIVLASGAAFTKTRIVSVVASARDTAPGKVVDMRFSGNGSTWSSWMTYKTTPSNIDLGSLGGGTQQGLKRWYAQFRDQAKNVSLTYSDSITLDSIAPKGSIVLAGGAARTNSRVVSVRALATDPAPGKVTSVRYSGNGSTWSSWATYTGAVSTANLTTLGGGTGDGVKTWYAQFRDEALNVSSTYSDSIMLDTRAPTGRIVIAAGANFTNTSVVKTVASASDQPPGKVTHMRYSGNGTTWGPWQNYLSSTVLVDLTKLGGGTGDGVKTWYVQFRDDAMNLSAAFSDTILLDRVAPKGSVVLAGGATYTTSITVKMLATATDTAPGKVSEVSYSANGSTWSAWQTYTGASTTVDLSTLGGGSNEGTKRWYARFRDQALNVSAPSSDTIIYDATAPIITSVVVPSPTASLSNIATLTATGSPSLMQWSMNGSIWSPWRPYSSQLIFDLSQYGGNTSQGSKALRVRARDLAANVSGVAQASFLYRTAPTLSSLSPTSIPVVYSGKVMLTGSNLKGVTSVEIIGMPSLKTGSADDWFKGWFRAINATQIELHFPQNYVPGTYQVRASNGTSRSQALSLKIVPNRSRDLGLPSTLTGGKALDILVHRGAMPANSFDLLTFSASGLPLVFPGLVSLGHGGSATTFIDPSFLVFPGATLHDQARGTAHWKLPLPKGMAPVKLHFQALMFDPLQLSVLPIRTSSAGVLAVR